MPSLSLLFSLPLSLAVLFSSPGQPGASSSPLAVLTAPLLRGSPAEGDRVEPDAEDLKRMEEGLGLQRESSEAPLPSLPSFLESLASAEYIAITPPRVTATPRPEPWSRRKKFMVGLGCFAAGGLLVDGIVRISDGIEMDAERCAADVIGRMVDEGCLDPSSLRVISDPDSYVVLHPQQTEYCYRLSEETLQCCSLWAFFSSSEMFDWSGVSEEAREHVIGEVCAEKVDFAKWCYGERKYASYFSD